MADPVSWSWLPWAAQNLPPSRDQQVFQQLKNQVDQFELDRAAATDAAKAAAANQANADLQREFAQHGIRWRVEDAKAAGIHPLYALGASGASAAPSFTVEGSGQDLSRAIHATRTEPERRFAQLQMEKMQLENMALGLQVHNLAQSQFGPAQPGALYLPQPSKTVAVDPAAPGREAGAINEIAYSRMGNKYYPTYSKDMKERSEDDIFEQALFVLKNRVLPFLAGTDHPSGYFRRNNTPPPPSDKLPASMKWKWNGVYYTPVPK